MSDKPRRKTLERAHCRHCGRKMIEAYACLREDCADGFTPDLPKNYPLKATTNKSSSPKSE